METTKFAEHDLSLVFDSRGRLWKFRATGHGENARGAHGAETANVTLDAGVTAAGLVVTLALPGIEPGDIEVDLAGDVLRLNGRGARMGDLACTVSLPRRIAIANVQTAYTSGAFEVLLPAEAVVRAEATEAAAAAETVSRETVTV